MLYWSPIHLGCLTLLLFADKALCNLMKTVSRSNVIYRLMTASAVFYCDSEVKLHWHCLDAKQTQLDAALCSVSITGPAALQLGRQVPKFFAVIQYHTLRTKSSIPSYHTTNIRSALLCVRHCLSI